MGWGMCVCAIYALWRMSQIGVARCSMWKIGTCFWVQIDCKKLHFIQHIVVDKCE